MESVSQYIFHKTKYGSILLIDVVELKTIKKYLQNKCTHTLTYYDITFITSGKGYFRIDNQKYDVASSDIVFSKPGEVREWATNSIENGYALIFEEEFLLSFFNDKNFIRSLSYFSPERPTAKLSLSHELSERIFSLVKNIKEEIDSYQEKDTHILRALLYEILMLLHREYNKVEQNNSLYTPKANIRHIDNFIKLVDSDYTFSQNTHYYADKLCLTPNYLNEVVKKSMGVNAKTYIQNKILIEAKRLLQYSPLSIIEISERLNFNSSSYFIRFFHYKTGMTPLQYRNNAGK